MVARLRDAIQRGTNAARPAATAVDVGTLYYDTTNSTLARSNGTSWESVAESSSGGTPSFVGCIAVRTTDQTGVATATNTAVSFTGTDELDTDAFHDPASNPSRITIPSGKGGKYLLTGYVIWDSDTTGQRRILFYKNGSVLIGGTNTLGSLAGGIGYAQQTTSIVVALAVADYVELYVTQNSGTNRTLSGATAALRFSATLLGT
jgi:hypothetical protein